MGSMLAQTTSFHVGQVRMCSPRIHSTVATAMHEMLCLFVCELRWVLGIFVSMPVMKFQQNQCAGILAGVPLYKQQLFVWLSCNVDGR